MPDELGASREVSNLKRHVPELALDWIASEPERKWRAIDGTLCFADISGFTALAERLAQRGRIGGEELAEIRGQSGRFLAVATREGASA